MNHLERRQPKVGWTNGGATDERPAEVLRQGRDPPGTTGGRLLEVGVGILAHLSGVGAGCISPGLRSHATAHDPPSWDLVGSQGDNRAVARADVGRGWWRSSTVRRCTSCLQQPSGGVAIRIWLDLSKLRCVRMELAGQVRSAEPNAPDVQRLVRCPRRVPLHHNARNLRRLCYPRVFADDVRLVSGALSLCARPGGSTGPGSVFGPLVW
jgi:hypothetical protein